MNQWGWPERLGAIIGPTVVSAVLGTLSGISWSFALHSTVANGAKWGCIIGAGIVFVLTFLLMDRPSAIKGMGLMFGGIYLIIIVLGLIVGIIRLFTG